MWIHLTNFSYQTFGVKNKKLAKFILYTYLYICSYTKTRRIKIKNYATLELCNLTSLIQKDISKGTLLKYEKKNMCISWSVNNQVSSRFSGNQKWWSVICLISIFLNFVNLIKLCILQWERQKKLDKNFWFKKKVINGRVRLG